MAKYVSEFLGTFAILLIGAGSIALDNQSGGSIGLLGISAVFGTMVAIMILVFGHVSGAHFNPAVSLAFLLAKRFPARDFIPYFLAQAAGGLAAIYLLKIIFSDQETLALTLPSSPVFTAFFTEILLAFILLIVIFWVSDGKSKLIPAAWIIGIAVTLEIYFGAAISGASFNPVRSLPPAIAYKHFEYLWIYLTAPFIGAALAYFTYKQLHNRTYV